MRAAIGATGALGALDALFNAQQQKPKAEQAGQQARPTDLPEPSPATTATVVTVRFNADGSPASSTPA
jgi:hypothetical protein